MQFPNRTTYRGEFTGLRLNAFGIYQIVKFTGVIEIYQARVSPELWRARPSFGKGAHKWEACSADALMDKIQRDFVGILKPWRVAVVDPRHEKRSGIITGQPRANCSTV